MKSLRDRNSKSTFPWQIWKACVRNEGEFIEIITPVTACRDPKDDFLLSLAKDGKATRLIMGDKDLLDIKVFGKTKILRITDYLATK